MVRAGQRSKDDTSAASMANSISSSHTVDQNSTAWRATRSSGWFIPRTVNFVRVSSYEGRKEWIAYTKKSSLHVIAHLVVIKAHNPHKCFEGGSLHLDSLVLCGFTHDLHDIISLALCIGEKWDYRRKNSSYLSLKIVFDKVERIVKGLDGSELHFRRWLLPAGALNDGCEDLIGAKLENFWSLV